MAITAKRISPDGVVMDVCLQDIPNDIDLIRALGGQGDITFVGLQHDPWEVFRTTQGEDRLVVGSLPGNNDIVQKVRTCDLNAEEVKNVVRLADPTFLKMES